MRLFSLAGVNLLYPSIIRCSINNFLAFFNISTINIMNKSGLRIWCLCVTSTFILNLFYSHSSVCHLLSTIHIFTNSSFLGTIQDNSILLLCLLWVDKDEQVFLIFFSIIFLSIRILWFSCILFFLYFLQFKADGSILLTTFFLKLLYFSQTWGFFRF